MHQIGVDGEKNLRDPLYMKALPARQLVGVQEAADILGLSVWTIRAWSYSGRISSYKLGRRLMISQDEINRIMAESLRPRLGVR